MRVTILHRGQRLSVLRRGERAQRPMRFSDHAEAARFLEELRLESWSWHSLLHAFDYGDASEIAIALATGRVQIDRLPRPPALALVPPERASGSASEPMRSERRALEWIQIELVDDDGEPLRDAPIRLELPDGSLRTGTTDHLGRFRLDAIQGGSCRVRFDMHTVSR